MLPALLLLLALLPANLSSTLLQTSDPLTGEPSRWEGWVGTVQASDLPEGARASLVDSLGAEVPGSAANATGGRAALPMVSRLPGVLRLAVNGTPANGTLLLDGSYRAGPVLHFGRPGGPLWAEVCVSEIRNHRGHAIPNASLASIPVSIAGAGARTDRTGCALLPAPGGISARSLLSGLPGPEVPAPSAPDGLLFSFPSGGGRSSEFFERGPLRSVTVTASRNVTLFTLVVEPLPDGSLLFWSRRPAEGVEQILLGFQGPGSLLHCPRRQTGGCVWAPLPAAASPGGFLVAPLPDFGIIRMNQTTGSPDTAILSVLAVGVVASILILLLARRKPPPVPSPLERPGGTPMPPSDRP